MPKTTYTFPFVRLDVVKFIKARLQKDGGVPKSRASNPVTKFGNSLRPFYGAQEYGYSETKQGLLQKSTSS